MKKSLFVILCAYLIVSFFVSVADVDTTETETAIESRMAHIDSI